MLAQYLEVKRAHPDSLLFYRMGDFYEMFFQDALDAASALDITLTKRGKVEGLDVPMCGVPYHAVDSYLARLIKRGFRVAICEQSENPETAKERGNKGPLKRDVVRVVTPGTLIEDEFLPPRQNNFLLAIGSAGGEQGLAWVDISTGDLFVETAPDNRLSETLARLAPAEIIASNHPQSDLALTEAEILFREARDFDSKKGERLLKELYGVTTLDGMAELNRAELAAMGGLIAYLAETQKTLNLVLKPLQRLTAGGIMEIDPASRRSLEITHALSGKTEGSLLTAIDATRSSAGGRLLTARLAAPLTDLEEINARFDLADALLQAPVFMEELGKALGSMPDLERAMARLGAGHGGPRDLGMIKDALNATIEIIAALKNRDDSKTAEKQFKAMIKRLSLPLPLIDSLSASLADELPLLARDGGFVRKGANAALDEARLMRDDSLRLIAQLQAEYSQKTGISSLKIKHNNVLGYHIEVRSNHADKMAGDSDFIHRQTTAQTVRFTTTKLGDLEREISTAAERALAHELEIFAQLRQQVLDTQEALAGVAEDVARLDVAYATASVAEKWQYCRPILAEDNSFHITDGRHPVVEQMLNKGGEEPFVANSCALSSQDRIWLLTGPNMAGKSTFLRQNALIAIMAQAGFFVPAAKAEIGVVDRLFCRVGASDDLASGRSTFMVEMVETAAILNRSGERALVILDEIGRGTATYDGLSLAWAVVEYLHEVNKCRALFATHYHELGALTKNLEALTAHAMKVREWEGDIVFLHEVVEGSADRSYGIHVARLAGVPQAVISRAEEVLKSLITENNSIRASAIDELPLFTDTPSPSVQQLSQKPSAALELLATIMPDTLTPREALEILYQLKALKDEEKQNNG